LSYARGRLLTQKPDKGAETLSAAPKETVSPITPATGTEEEEENKERRKDQDEVPFNELLVLTLTLHFPSHCLEVFDMCCIFFLFFVFLQAGVTFVISGIQNPERGLSAVPTYRMRSLTSSLSFFISQTA